LVRLLVLKVGAMQKPRTGTPIPKPESVALGARRTQQAAHQHATCQCAEVAPGFSNEFTPVLAGIRPRSPWLTAPLPTARSLLVLGLIDAQLLQQHLFHDFAQIWPERFTNITNGVTPRRWLAVSNPHLSSLLDESIGEGWRTDLEQLSRLEPLAQDPAFQERWRAMRAFAKDRLAQTILQQTGVLVDPASLFDVQVKRIHEYKRQHLAALQLVERYLRLRQGEDLPPRTVVFGGKAAPGYAMAKLIIRLIVGIADIVNIDPAMDGRLRVIFLPNFSVSLGQRIYPAVDLSEQISTAGMEASGTGNMKMSLNGALTIGTLDGANVEIREKVGSDNFFLFGHTAEQLAALNRSGYHPIPWLENEPLTRAAIDLIGSGHFSEGDRQLFHPLLSNLCSSDPFRVMADIADYRRAQNDVDGAWLDSQRWTQMSILNTARCGFFSSDRSIHEYAERIWKVKPVPVGRMVPVPHPAG
jgi:starch phosphorylase